MQDTLPISAQVSGGLVAIPLPMVSALLGLGIAVMLWRLDWGPRAASCFLAALFVLLSLTSVLVGLRFGYDLAHLIMVQRLLPLLVGPLMYLSFAAFALEAAPLRRAALLHLGAALGMITAIAAIPRPLLFLDWVISASYLVYLILLLRLWRKGADHLSRARLDVAPVLRNWLLRAAMLLGAILLFDTAIALDFVLFGGRHVPAMISIGAIPSALILLALLIALPGKIAQSRAAAPKARTQAPHTEAQAVEAAARDMLHSTQLYLEPDLSVQRIARRLQMPVRTLSAAINQTQGINVSQYVNRFRLEHAADLLRGTNDSVAKVMSQSGFLTRSNFYREFQNAYGITPAAYRDQGKGPQT